MVLTQSARAHLVHHMRACASAKEHQHGAGVPAHGRCMKGCTSLPLNENNTSTAHMVRLQKKSSKLQSPAAASCSLLESFLLQVGTVSRRSINAHENGRSLCNSSLCLLFYDPEQYIKKFTRPLSPVRTLSGMFGSAPPSRSRYEVIARQFCSAERWRLARPY